MDDYVYVELGLFGYKGISGKEAASKFNKGYAGVVMEVEGEDTKIMLIWRQISKVSDADLKQKVIDYYEYVSSITGVPMPMID